MNKLFLLLLTIVVVSTSIEAQVWQDKFRQLEEILPTPNDYRTASGAPGHEYWQQQVDYKINVNLDDAAQRLTGSEQITYHNNSPDALSYLWLQLDQNLFEKKSDTYKIKQSKISDKMTASDIMKLSNVSDYDGGFKIESVKDANGNDLSYIINRTMMRVDLPKTLQSGQEFSFNIKWSWNINDRSKVGGRAGYEYFPEDKNYLYTLAHFYPRLCAYYDVYGWQHKQFLGAGEFTLDFGNYEVNITAPSDHIVGATGVLQNPKMVLNSIQMERFEKAKIASEPIKIVNNEEALAAEKSNSSNKKTWTFKAENVRDFAFVSSRKFIWDVVGVKFGNRTVMAMSYYPKEGNPLWEKYSTKVVAHTIKWYSHYTFDYPYPVAISVHTNNIGMEYPMICFNGGRPEKDGTYTERTKYGMLGVIIHEVGHNFFPMIVNSDERQWTWMDEGLNTYLQYLTEQQWERDYPSSRGPAQNIVPYMNGDPARLEPIMTNSESLRQFGNNAYAKTATGLNILRETVVGRELFDYAFKEYAKRWMFKRPTPADFFRTIEDASGTDLDWFWKGWFYTTDVVDISIDSVLYYHLDTENPITEKALFQNEKDKNLINISTIRNKEISKTQDEIDTSLRDFYTDYNELKVTDLDKREYDEFVATLNDEEKKVFAANNNYYEITFGLKGGIPMPIIVQLQYTDGSTEDYKIPVEIWRLGDSKVTKVFVSNKELKQIILDPYLETADVNTNNNYYPPRQQMSRFELFKAKKATGENPMQRAKRGTN